VTRGYPHRIYRPGLEMVPRGPQNPYERNFQPVYSQESGFVGPGRPVLQ
jgi:hypothetical protein